MSAAIMDTESDKGIIEHQFNGLEGERNSKLSETKKGGDIKQVKGEAVEFQE